MRIEPYLMFNGRTEEAVQFYQRTLGAQLQMLMRFKDNPDPPPPGTLPDGSENLVMHCGLQIGQTLVMASDGMGPYDGKPSFAGITLSITAPDEAEAARRFNALAEGGQITMPLGKTFWSPCFGMLVDRFGVSWMVGVDGPMN